MTQKLLKANVEEIFELNMLQQGMLHHYLTAPDSNVYAVLLSLRIEGELNVAVLEKALKLVQANNEVLRTVFRWEGLEKPLQVVLKAIPLPVSYHTAAPTAITSILEEARTSNFDLTELAVRVSLIEYANSTYLLNIAHHHILYDGWSTGVFLKELFGSYYQLLAGQQPVFAPKPTLKAIWQARGKNSSESADFWINYLNGYTNTPYFFSSKPLQHAPAAFGKEAAVMPLKPIDTFAREHQVSKAALLYAAYGLLLQQYSASADVIFGTPFSGRESAMNGIDQVMGNFVNTIPMRLTTREGQSLLQLVQSVNEQLSDISLHAATPYAEIRQLLHLKPADKLFDSIMAVENYPLDEALMQNVNGLQVSLNAVFEQTDIPLVVTFLIRKEITVELVYNQAVIGEDYAQLFARHLVQIIHIICANSERKVEELSLLDEASQQLIIHTFNDTRTEYPSDKSVHALFSAQALLTPEAIALTAGDRNLSYHELEIQSGCLTACLQQYQIAAGEPVAILADRSIEAIIAMLGILKAGAVFLPLDPTFPAERIHAMLAAAKVRLVLTQAAHGHLLQPDIQQINIATAAATTNAPNPVAVAATDPAYIMYTSGSTGQPKGVVVTHRNIIRLVKGNHFIPLDNTARILQTGAPAFDAITFEIWGALLNGGHLFIIPREAILDNNLLGQAMSTYSINRMWLTSALLNQHIQSDVSIFAPLKFLVAGGDALKAQYINQLRQAHPALQVVNGYGPTENTTFSATYSIPTSSNLENIPIGKPISNSTAYVCGTTGNLQPIGVPGELYVGGDGVAAGYLHDPELTAIKFVNNPLLPGDRLYRTGDLCRWLPDGNLMFLGRIDTQVKIRGNRVELGEIEHVLQQFAGIQETVVAVNGEGDEKYIVAYYVAPAAINADELQAFLAEKLPEYMQPAAYVYMSRLPLNTNGKVDRKALPAAQLIANGEYVAPADTIQEKIQEIWAELLKKASTTISIAESFFDLGGHSLNATTLTHRLFKVFGVKITIKDIFLYPTIAGLSGLIKNAQQAKYTVIEKAEEKTYYPLSTAQRRLYVLYEFDRNSLAYNMFQAFRVEGAIDTQRLENAFHGLLQRHASLRTSFTVIDGIPFQKIIPVSGFAITIHNPQPDIQELIQNFSQPFDLEAAPLIRVGLITTDTHTHYLLVDMHHIINDGVSLSVLVNDLMRLYNNEVLAPLKLQYHDYAVWQQSPEQQQFSAMQRDFWLKEYETLPAPLTLPTDFPRPRIRSHQGAVEVFELNKETTIHIKHLAEQEGTTIFMVLFAAYSIWLSKLSGQEDVVVGTPVSGRVHADLEGMIGMFVNTLPLRCQPKGDLTFVSFLAAVKQQLLSCFEHQQYQYEDLIEHLRLDRDTSRNPLFDVLFSFENFDDTTLTLPGLTFTPLERKQVVAKFDITLSGKGFGGHLVFALEYNQDLFTITSIRRYIDYFKNLLTAIIIAPNNLLSAFDMLSLAQREELTATFNNTTVAYPRNSTISELFAAQALLTPKQIAITAGDTDLTYEALDQRASQVARVLNTFALSPAERVGIVGFKSAHSIVAILGILKAGGAYLMLDPDFPADRVKDMLLGGDARLVLTEDPAHFPLKEGVTVLNINQLPAVEDDAPLLSVSSSAESIACVLYTSGSTGKPKGVAISNRNIIRMVKHAAHLPFGNKLRILHAAAPTFDLINLEIWGALLNGGRLYPVPKDIVLDTYLLGQVLHQQQIQFMWMTSSLFNQHMQVDPGIFSSLECLTVGGDVVNPVSVNEVRRLHPALKVINGYGPTENGIFSTTFPILQDYRFTVPIGRPVNNSTVYILSRYGGLQGIGIPGDIYVGGDGVAIGYLNDVQLTREKFIDHPFVPGQRLYKTGDMGYWRTDGNILFLGRTDTQVKIRGNRVELGEIEEVLQKYQGMKHAIVQCREKDGSKYLAAYYVSDSELDSVLLQAYLSERLPDYMVPAVFLRLQQIPLLPSGKANLNALPEPVLKNSSYQAPVSEEEILLAAIWAKVLGISQVGATDNFFSLGGDSIKSIQIISKVRAAGYELSMKDIFANQMIVSLAKCLKIIRVHTLQETVMGTSVLTPVQRYFLEAPAKAEHHFNQAVMLHFSLGISTEEVSQIFTFLQQHHDALRIVLKNTPEGFRLDNMSADLPVSLTAYEAYDEATCTTLQGSIDLHNGPLMKLGLFQGADGSHLLIAVHHLVIDGISWRILLEDLTTLFHQLKQKQNFSLPSKTMPFLSWAMNLKKYMETPAYSKGRQYWQEQGRKGLQGDVTRDVFTGSNRGDEMQTVRFTLNENRTKELLRQGPDTFRTSVEEMLLAAFITAVSQYYGQQQVSIDLEGHGREELMEGLDVSRTIGWFTSIYPVMLELKGSTWSDRLRHVKETLRNIPNKGIDYLLCKYYDTNGVVGDNSRISFNYLGQFESNYKRSAFSTGMTVNPQATRAYDWDVVGMIVDNQLEISMAYSGAQYQKDTMLALLQLYESSLLSLISYCLDKAHTALSPSDLTGNNISMDTLDALQAQYRLQDIYPLSPMQEGMLFHTLHDGKNDPYFEQISYLRQGHQDVGALAQTIKALVDRYDMLRTVFLHEGYDRALQLVLKDREADFSFLDLQEICAEEGEQTVIARCQEEDRERKFVLDKDALLRLTVVQVGAARYRFIWSFHHILMDGWCMGLLIHDFNELYEAAAHGRNPQLEPVRPYSNYIRWLEQRDPQEGLTYWEQYLQGYDLPAGLPKRNTLTEQTAFQPASSLLKLSPEQGALLNEVSVKFGVSVYTVFQCIWGLLLQRYNDREDVVFGSVVSGRPVEVEGVESMLGLFINTVPVRIRTVGNERIGELFQRIQQELLDSEAYHYNLLPDIQSRSEVGRQLLDHILIYENYPISEGMGGHISEMEVVERTNYDLSIVIVPGHHFIIRFDYNSERYSSRIISQVMKHLEQLVTLVAGNPDRLVEEVAISCSQEGYNDTTVAFAQDLSVISLFEQQVTKTPDAIALEHAGEKISYVQLDRMSTDLAAYLVSQGIGAGDFVGVLLDREPGFVYSVLAILKTGAAYIPVDTIYPAARIAGIFGDAGVKAVITRSEYSSQCSGFQAICLDELADLPKAAPLPAITGTNGIAYMIYTSGSTGTPKGVMISHRSLTHYIQWASTLYLNNTKPVFALYTSVAFDLTITSLFTPLITGGRLLLYSGHDSLLLEEVIKDNRSTVLKMTPSHLKLLSEMQLPVSPVLQTLIVGGEQLESRVAAAVQRLYPAVAIYNEYGPTEATVGCMHYRYNPSDPLVNVPIGYPASNTQIYLLDGYHRPVPEGATGELYIAGEGLAQGYYGRSALTNEVFVPNPFVPGTLMYRSKDTAIYDAAYGLLFTGRRDSQLKVRGYRIEPGEIVHHVCMQPGIKEAAVLQKNGQLVCYYVTDETQDSSALQSALQTRLPAYMVPSYYIHISSLPLTSNGKLDESKLPDPALGTAGYEAPVSDAAIQLAGLWAEVLHITAAEISATASFFGLGGHSVKAMRLKNLVRKHFGCSLELRDIFTYATLNQMAGLIEKRQPAVHLELVKAGQLAAYIASPAQERMYYQQMLNKDNLGFNIAAAFRLTSTVIHEKLHIAFAQLIQRHTSLRTYFELTEQGLVQKVMEQVPAEIYFTAHVNAHSFEEVWQQFIQPFDLGMAPLMRYAVWKDYLLIDIHHIICDGISLNILIGDLRDIYQQKQLPPVAYTYLDYAVHLATRKDIGDRDLAYWRQQLSGELPRLDLPVMQERNFPAIHPAAVQTLEIQGVLYQQLQQFVASADTSTYVLLLSAYYILLHKIGGNKNLIVGIDAAGRSHEALQEVVGTFVNILPLKMSIAEGLSAQQFLTAVKSCMLDAIDHQEYQFDQMLALVTEEDRDGRNAIFDVHFAFANTLDSDQELQALGFIPVQSRQHETTQYEFKIEVAAKTTGLSVGFIYSTLLYEDSTMEVFAAYYQNILTAIIHNSQVLIEDIPLETPVNV
ncbi:amino acid adenylation domain-containing protein [Chitinophaga sp. Hz27]|uniref:amino acid adenylation domain-containing protein n=1 Tax=Chitinophaga sp. Hz27 TaxID=3347169 RepID=UPI0035DA8ED5